MSGAAIMAFGRSRTPNATSSSASACTGSRASFERSATTRASAAGDQPDHGEQHVAPDHPDEQECRRRERDERRRQAEPRRAARRRERDQAEAHPIQRGDQQEHAQRAGRDRIDQPPGEAHRRRLPVAEAPVPARRVDVGGVDGDVARMEHQDGERVAGGEQRQDRHDHAERRAALFGRGRLRGRAAGRRRSGVRNHHGSTRELPALSFSGKGCRVGGCFVIAFSGAVETGSRSGRCLRCDASATRP